MKMQYLYYRLIIINPQIPDLYNNLALILKIRKLEEAEEFLNDQSH